MALTKQDVQHLADLARLELTEEEIDTYRGQLGSILEYVAKLQELDTEGVEPMAQGAGLENVLRDDEVAACDPEVRRRIIEAFPSREGDLLKVQAVFEERTE